MSETSQDWPAKAAVEYATQHTLRTTRTVQCASTSSTAFAGPKTRQRIHKPPEPLAVPDIEEDAAERKRVLNVLAQRRYRERRRQKKAKQGSATQAGAGVEAGTGSETGAGAGAGAGAGGSGGGIVTNGEQMIHTQDFSATLGSGLDLADASIGLDLGEVVPFEDLIGTAPQIVDEMGVSTTLDDLDFSSSSSMALADFSFELSLSTSLATMAAAEASATGPWDLGTSKGIISTSRAPSPPSPTTGISPHLLRASASSSSMVLSASPYSYPSFSSRSSVVDQFSPDSYVMPIAELSLLRAVMRIADRLGCTEGMWKIDGQSPFLVDSQNSQNSQKRNKKNGDTDLVGCSPASAEACRALLPPNWRPTHAQRHLPHHPSLDILPWPSVRENIITLLSLPLDERPPIAADPLALIHFLYDLEDSAEGLRIWGTDPCDPTCWEVGQVLFERWWFIFDREVIEQSNRWRDRRGAARLRAVSTDTRTKGVMDFIWL